MRYMLMSELIYFDMPFGLGLAEWDQAAYSPDQFADLFAQLNIVNTKSDHALVLIIHWRQAGATEYAMQKAGYTGIHPIYVQKPSQNAKGMGFIFSVEVALIGYKRSRSTCELFFDNPDPTHRHNMIYSHNVRQKATSPTDNEHINTTQKHPILAYQLAKVICQPGDNALVVGAGSGSDLMGMARAQVNVVGIEKEARQFAGIYARLTAHVADAENFLDEEIKEVAALTLEASKFGLNRQKPEKKKRAQKKKPENDDANENQASGPPIQPEQACCPACGQTSQEKLHKCNIPSCESRIHKACSVVECHVVCSDECKKIHACL